MGEGNEEKDDENAVKSKGEKKGDGKKNSDKEK